MDFSEKYELYACLQCGKCTGGCPVALRAPLNIRSLMREVLLGGNPDRALDHPALWDCTTCATCTLRCPRGLKPAEFIVGLRGELVEGGRVPKTIIDALEGTYKHGNPWGRARQKRIEWKEGLEVKIIPEGGDAEWLYFVGCAPSYDPRLQGVPRTLCRMLEAAGVSFGILGTKESCCGNEIRRMGEEGLFEELMEENTNHFRSSGARAIVTTSPHCFNVFGNEYDLNGLQVLHYTQFLSGLLKEGKVQLPHTVKKKVVYHDPCFLGKQNGVFDPPREVLRAIPGIELIEFERSRERSLCCEGGGGRMWVEGTGEGARNSEIRVQDAHAMGADVIATACPFCLLTLEDGAKTTGLEEQVLIKDILELIGEAMGFDQE
jgi:Fe-S oxidoreductase